MNVKKVIERSWNMHLGDGVVFVVFLLVVGCGQDHSRTTSLDSVVRESGNELKSTHDSQSAAYERNASSIEAAIALGDRSAEERRSGSYTNDVPLPNFVSGPGLPRPLGANFYEIDLRYEGYLLCTFSVDEASVDSVREYAAFRSALDQIRSHGQTKFPRIEWIAVVIENLRDHDKSKSPELRIKAGAIFNARAVFDRDVDLAGVTTNTSIHRQPLRYEPQIRPGWSWTMVERHASGEMGKHKSF